MKPKLSYPILVVGNPENQRIAFFQAALSRLRRPPASVVAYADILANKSSLAAHLQPGTILRIESPGENFEVERGLLRAGIAEAESEGSPVLTANQLAQQTFDRGLILHPR